MPAVNDFDANEPIVIAELIKPVIERKQLPVTTLCNGNIMLFNADCFDVLAHLKPASVNMVFADLPYGTTQNKWDSVLPLTPLWKQLLHSGLVTTPYVFTAQSPFNIILGASNLPMLKYEWIWDKDHGSGHLNAKKQPLRTHENILVFYDQQCIYNPQMEIGKPYNVTSAYSDNRSSNYGMQEQVRTINNGTRYPKSIVKIKRDVKRVHPTQKPVKLLEYLIKTYTNEGDLVLDPTMGSGTTAVACKHLNRRCIGIELDKNYFDIAVNRVINE